MVQPVTDAFSILAMPVRFALEAEQIEEAWRARIALVHPDRFAGRPASERRVAEQWAGCINEAKDALLDPVKRATLLLAKRGVDVGAEKDTRMSSDFLMQQMSWREALEEAQNEAALNALTAEVEDERKRLMQVLTDALDVTPNADKAREAVRRLMFVQKIRKEIFERQAQ